MQEAARKDVEWAFGVLQARFAIVSRLARGWHHDNLQRIMKCCVILHNMIIENKRGMNGDYIYDGTTTSATIDSPDTSWLASFSQFVSNFQRIINSNLHNQLCNNLVSHLWALKVRSETKRKVS
jgi:hypothetical protein